MDYIDTGITKPAIGVPSEEERERLIEDGYTFMCKGKTEYFPYTEYEIWIK